MEATLNNKTAPTGMRWSPLKGKFVPDVPAPKLVRTAPPKTDADIVMQRLACLNKLKTEGKISADGYAKMLNKIVGSIEVVPTEVTPVAPVSKPPSYIVGIGGTFLGMCVLLVIFAFIFLPKHKEPVSNYSPVVSDIVENPSKALEVATVCGFSIGVAKSCGVSQSNITNFAENCANKINSLTSDSYVRGDALKKVKAGLVIGAVSSRNMSSSDSECSKIRDLF